MRVNTGRTLVIAIVAVFLWPLLAMPAMAQSVPWAPRPVTASIQASGVSFPEPLFKTWIAAYKDVNPSVKLKYNAVGTGVALNNFLKYEVDFSSLDAVLPSDRIANEAPDALHVPVAIGAVVPIYNVPHLPAGTTLRFSGETLAGIYLGEIRRWNHPAIAADNPGVSLPSIPIKVFYRSDNARNTLTLTEFLSSASPAWKSRIGSGTRVAFPTGIGVNSSERMGNRVTWTQGAIGYVDLVLAMGANIPLPPIKNAAGNYVAPTLESVTAAAESADVPADMRGTIANAPGANAYPIAGFSYVLLRQQTYTDMAKAQALTDFLYWDLTEGQGATTKLGYAPLPENIRKRAMAQLQQVTVNGEQVFDGPIQ